MNNGFYVGNLPYTADDQALARSFGAYGTVQSAKVMTDRDTGRSKGFGFVEMATDAEAQAAIDGLHGSSLQGRAMTVNVARPREARPSSGYEGRGGRTGGGRSSYY